MWLPSGAGLDPSTNWEDPVNQSHTAEMRTSACSCPCFISHFSLYARHFPEVQMGPNPRAACGLGVRGGEESRVWNGGQSDVAPSLHPQCPVSSSLPGGKTGSEVG